MKIRENNFLNDDIENLKSKCDISLILGVGSYFQNSKNYKDIDLIIVSEDFFRKTYCERLLICNYDKLKLKYDLFLYTLSEYQLLQEETIYTQYIKNKSLIIFKKEGWK